MTRLKEEKILHLVKVPKLLAQRIVKEKIEMAVYKLLFHNSWKIEELGQELGEEKYQDTQKMRIYFRHKFNKPLKDFVNYPKNNYSIQNVINMAILLIHKDPAYQFEPYCYLKPLSTSTSTKNDFSK